MGVDAKAAVEAPSYFKCPISLCVMTDPVSVCTGITYERASIEKWLEEGRRICPVTMQELESQELIPNHTLQRIIHAWRCENRIESEDGRSRSKDRLEQQQRQRLQIDALDAHTLVQQLRLASSRPAAVKRLDLSRSKPLLLEAGLAPVLVAVLPDSDRDSQARIIVLLSQLVASLDAASRKALVSPTNLSAIAWLLQRGDLHARIAAASLLEELSCADREARGAIGATRGVFEGLVRLIGEDAKQHRAAIRGSLRAVLAVCPPMKNRIRLVDAGAVAPLVELLVESDTVTTEAILAALECLCGVAEGRAAVARHALAIPAVTKKLFKVSDMATEYAIDVLWAVCKYCPDELVKRRMVEVGLFPKLFFFLQIGCNPRTKHKAGDLLRLLHRAYRECVDGDGHGDGASDCKNADNNNDDNTCLLTAAA